MKSSGRWNPTAEQMEALEELYRGGIRTPSTQLIQHIASKLSVFGRIEGKNVFYWFQNHKARDRLKRLRLLPPPPPPSPHHHHHNITHSSSSVLRRTGAHRVQQTKTCLSSSPTQDLVPANNKQNSNSNGTTEESEGRSEGEKDATWQIPMIPSDTSQYNHHLIISSQVAGPDKEIIMNQNQYNLSREVRTLDLFPVNGNQEITDDKERETEVADCTGARNPNSFCCNYYYYEFMPLKN